MINIGKHAISDRDNMYIIAEVGVNHNGSVETAKKLIDCALEAGAGAVKFQMFSSDALVSDRAALVEYQKGAGYKNQKEMLKTYELGEAQFRELKSYCDGKGIAFLATPFDPESARVLHELGVEAFKIGSGDISHFPLLAQVSQYGKPILLSTGMSTLKDIEAVLQLLGSASELVLFHCTSAYPAPFRDLHLRAIHTLKSAFAQVIGYSDHSLGLEVPFAAAALGYKVLEKHLTLDRSMEGPDHKASLEPAEFKRMVEGIRNIELALGHSRKRVAPSEADTRKLVRRGIYAGKDLDKGHRLGTDDLLYLRPLSDIEACDYERVAGKTLIRPMKKGEALKWSDFD